MAKCPFPAVLAVLTGLFCYVLGSKHAIRMSYYGLQPTVCRTTPGLSRAQIKVCEQEPQTTAEALKGLEEAAKECRVQFKDHRWNCSALTPPKNLYSSAIFHKGFKETAFVYALSSAAVVLSVGKACAESLLADCTCASKRSNKKFKWGGCSHNLKFGEAFSRRFLGAREDPKDIYAAINMHNNLVGVKVVKNNRIKKCKCHGVSASCQIKTCWTEAPKIRTVGDILMQKYFKAIKFDQFDQPNSSNRNNMKLLRRIIKKKRKEKRRLNSEEAKNVTTLKNDLDLVYYENSPSFCEKNQSLSILGTSGRSCNHSTHDQPDSCSSLCCGRGHNMVLDRRIENCNCRFLWCCTVECETCNKTDWVSVCK